MKATISFRQLWFNTSLLDFLFRKQARETLEEIMSACGARENPYDFDAIDDAIESNYETIEALEEDCYNLSAGEILGELGYTIEH